MSFLGGEPNDPDPASRCHWHIYCEFMLSLPAHTFFDDPFGAAADGNEPTDKQAFAVIDSFSHTASSTEIACTHFAPMQLLPLLPRLRSA